MLKYLRFYVSLIIKFFLFAGADFGAGTGVFVGFAGGVFDSFDSSANEAGFFFL